MLIIDLDQGVLEPFPLDANVCVRPHCLVDTILLVRTHGETYYMLEVNEKKERVKGHFHRLKRTK